MTDPLNSKNISDIVWIQTSFIGDIVLSTAAFRLCKKEFPQIRQHLITHALGAKVLKDHPDLDRIVLFDKDKFFFSSIRETKAALISGLQSRWGTVVLQPHRSTRSSLLAKAIGAPTVTYTETGLSSLAYRKIKREMDLHEKDRVSSLLEPLGVPRAKVLSSKLSMPVLLNTQNTALKNFLENGDVIGVSPGSHWATKEWPSERYLKICSKLLDAGYKILLIGSDKEQELKDSMKQQLEKLNTRTKEFVSTVSTSLDDLRYLYPKLKLLVCNDSSPVHYASAFNVPTVEIYGPTLPSFGFTALAEKSIYVENRSLECRPCSAHGPMKCPLKHFKCMNELSVESVWIAVANILQIS